ncbi:MAG: hypothetical protein ABSB76_26835 [Streptosporangiaceae bacterium]|jgi:hypothetical protein
MHKPGAIARVQSQNLSQAPDRSRMRVPRPALLQVPDRTEAEASPLRELPLGQCHSLASPPQFSADVH